MFSLFSSHPPPPPPLCSEQCRWCSVRPQILRNPGDHARENVLNSALPLPSFSSVLIFAREPCMQAASITQIAWGLFPMIFTILHTHWTYAGIQVFEHERAHTRVLPCSLPHKHTQRRSSLVPLLVTCNYVAMMSLIFCIGWKLRNAERLESAGKCLAVWNTNMLICEQWLKGKCFSMQPPPPLQLMLTSTELRLKGRLTDWLTGWLTGWFSPDGHVGSWLPDRPIYRPWGPEWTERKKRKRK